MTFNRHSSLEGQHAFLGASKYHWINYDEPKVREAYDKYMAAQRGTALHDFAAQCILFQQQLPEKKLTLNMYVNDAIKYGMTPEQVLYYSENCFGTADTICFRNGLLRIHDLKTGLTPAHMSSLKFTLLCFVWNTTTNRPKLIWNCGSISRTKYSSTILNRLIFCRLWIKSSPLTELSRKRKRREFGNEQNSRRDSKLLWHF